MGFVEAQRTPSHGMVEKDAEELFKRGDDGICRSEAEIPDVFPGNPITRVG